MRVLLYNIRLPILNVRYAICCITIFPTTPSHIAMYMPITTTLCMNYTHIFIFMTIYSHSFYTNQYYSIFIKETTHYLYHY